jgi:hypothetical protein
MNGLQHAWQNQANLHHFTDNEKVNNYLLLQEQNVTNKETVNVGNSADIGCGQQ